MKTTITIENAGLAITPLDVSKAAEQSSAESSDSGPVDADSGPVDAGAAPAADSSADSGSAEVLGGAAGGPPDWLLDAIAAAGGMTAPSSGTAGDLAGDLVGTVDAGPAPGVTSNA